jgi:predicted lysophospholipase L1 biosynthesis ABC-type transport system permease subunit
MNAQPAEQIKEIRDLMERSSRFISLSGLSGVGAGIIALAGALYAFFYLDYDLRYLNPDEYFGGEKPYLNPKRF